MREIISEITGRKTEVFRYGSREGGVSWRESDLDLCMVFQDMDGDDYEQMNIHKEKLMQISQVLDRQDWVVHTKLILNARIPVIKSLLLINSRHIKVDLSCLHSNHKGALSSHLLLHLYNQYPSLKLILLLLKVLLHKHSLNDSNTGGLTSY